METKYRFARKGDAALLLEFIRGLADYEKLSGDVVATEEMIDDEIFVRKSAEAIFALEDGREVGFALFYTSFSTFEGTRCLYLEDLFVKPEARGRGYGKMLITTVAGIAVERGYARLDWDCLDWNQPSIDFYLSLGARPLDGWRLYRLDGKALTDLGQGNAKTPSVSRWLLALDNIGLVLAILGLACIVASIFFRSGDRWLCVVAFVLILAAETMDFLRRKFSKK